MIQRLRIKNTDKRFKLYKYGFSHYLEIPYGEFRTYDRLTKLCQKNFKTEFWAFKNKIYNDGCWRTQYIYRNGRFVETHRIYFKGKKYITLLSLALTENDRIEFF